MVSKCHGCILNRAAWWPRWALLSFRTSRTVRIRHNPASMTTVDRLKVPAKTATSFPPRSTSTNTFRTTARARACPRSWWGRAPDARRSRHLVLFARRRTAQVSRFHFIRPRIAPARARTSFILSSVSKGLPFRAMELLQLSLKQPLQRQLRRQLLHQLWPRPRPL